MGPWRTVPYLAIVMLIFVKKSFSALENNRKTRVLMPDEFEIYSTSSSREEPIHPSELWRRASGSNPLFPFTRRTTEAPPPEVGQNSVRPAWSNPFRPGWWGSRPWLNWQSTEAPTTTTTTTTTSTTTTTVRPESATAASTSYDNRVAVCVCIDASSQCSLDFTLDPAMAPALVQRLTLTQGWDIPECHLSKILCCRLVSTTALTFVTQDKPMLSEIPIKPPPEYTISTGNSPLNMQDSAVVPPSVLASSCECLAESAGGQCPIDHVALQLISCPGVTCCKKPPVNNDTCHCLLEQYCPNKESSRQAPFCKAPYKLCCGSNTNVVLTPKPPPKPIQVNIPASNNCKCVPSPSECPIYAEVLFHLDDMDIRYGMNIICPKPSVVCCTTPLPSEQTTVTQKPFVNATSEEMCVCVDKENQCPKDHKKVPPVFGAQCGRPRVWCCKPDEALSVEQNFVDEPPSPIYVPTTTTTTTPESTSAEPTTVKPTTAKPIFIPAVTTPFYAPTTLKPSHRPHPITASQTPTNSSSIQMQSTSSSDSIGAWCHCTDKYNCKKFKLEDKVSESICGVKQILCCENDLTTKPLTTSLPPPPPLPKCVFDRLFPEEGSCICTERDSCRLETGAFFSDTPALCVAPLGACCRAMQQCRVSQGGLTVPWLAAVLSSESRALLCSAVVVHRLAVLVPASCVQGRDVSSLTVQFGVGFFACGLRVGLVVPSPADLALLTLEGAPQGPAHQLSPVCVAAPNDTIDTENCLVATLVKNTSRDVEIQQENVRLTENKDCNSVNVLQKSSEICTKTKFNYNRFDDNMCGSGWGAAVLCKVHGSRDRFSLVALHTRRGTNCVRGASLATSTRGRWLRDAVHYLSNICPQS